GSGIGGSCAHAGPPAAARGSTSPASVAARRHARTLGTLPLSPPDLPAGQHAQADTRPSEAPEKGCRLEAEGEESVDRAAVSYWAPALQSNFLPTLSSVYHRPAAESDTHVRCRECRAGRLG